MQYIDNASEQKRQGQRPRVIGDQNQHVLIGELTSQHGKRTAYSVSREQSP